MSYEINLYSLKENKKYIKLIDRILKSDFKIHTTIGNAEMRADPLPNGIELLDRGGFAIAIEESFISHGKNVIPSNNYFLYNLIRFRKKESLIKPNFKSDAIDSYEKTVFMLAQNNLMFLSDKLFDTYSHLLENKHLIKKLFQIMDEIQHNSFNKTDFYLSNNLNPHLVVINSSTVIAVIALSKIN